VRNVLNTLQVLEGVAAAQPAGVSELARQADLPKSTVQRCLHALRDAGWIRQTPGETTRWILTSKALGVAVAGSDVELRQVALPVMRALRDRTGETVHLMVPEGDRIVLVERAGTTNPVRIVLQVGTSLPMHASANGKAVLANLDPRTLSDLLRRLTLEPYTDTTVCDAAALQRELAAAKRRGYATNRGEWRSDICAVAAAVLDGAGSPMASLSISAPISRMPRAMVPKYGAEVSSAAAQVAAALRGDTDHG
jgi:IclR family transcriptional regulator, acetate operon repressor